MEDKELTISRSRISLTYPADFQLIAAMNPCPCGYYLHHSKTCSCTSIKLQRYWQRISGPLLDRIDIIIELPDLNKNELQQKNAGEASIHIRKRVITAKNIQLKRFRNTRFSSNSAMGPAEIRKYAYPETAALKLLNSAVDKLQLSARAYDRLIKISRTIADLNGSERVTETEITEALQLRSSFIK